LGEDALRHQRPFVLYWIARVSTALAHQMITVGVGWQMYALTGSALDLGLVGLAQFVPSVLLLLIAGHVADLHDRSRVLQMCAVAEALAALVLCAGSALGMLTPRAIFALVFLIGAARAFQIPTMQALLPSLVPQSMLARAIAANSTASQAATVAGPAIGGVVYIAGPAIVYGACAALFIAAGALIHFVRPRRLQQRPLPSTGLASMLDGIRFIRHRPVVLGAISLDLFAVRHERRAEKNEHAQIDVVLGQEPGSAPERIERHPLVQTCKHFWMRRLETDCHFELPRQRISKTETALSIGARQECRVRLDDHALEPADYFSDLIVIVGRNGGRVEETASVIELDLTCARKVGERGADLPGDGAARHC
jgi:hypothetical protein